MIEYPIVITPKTLKLKARMSIMMKYPSVITAEVLANTAHIPDAEIQKDIEDTEQEITNLATEIQGHRLIADANIGNPTGKMAAFRASAKEYDASERAQFVEFLYKLLEARKAQLERVN